MTISSRMGSDGLTILKIEGRIDGLTSPDLEREFERITSSGKRIIGIDFSAVNYISSAGLRVLLQTQKTLIKISGELLIVGMPPNIFEVFNVSGLSSIFKIADSFSAFSQPSELKTSDVPLTAEIHGLKIEYLNKKNVERGKLQIFGAQEKLSTASYTENDVIHIVPGKINCAAGLATLGNNYNDYKKLFGEAMIINGNFFYYPAVSSSRADYILTNEAGTLDSYKFLHGFGFKSEYSLITAFDEQDKNFTLFEIINVINELIESPLFGITFIATSAGIMGMNLKRSPVIENRPAEGDILNQDNFSDWMDYSIEPAFANHILAGTGIAVKDKSKLTDFTLSLFSSGSDLHVHAGIFDKSLMCKTISDFNSELDRIFNELNVYRIQHLLGGSLFKNAVVAVTELEA